MTLDIDKGQIELAHGSGGQASDRLLRELILPAMGLEADRLLLDGSSVLSLASTGPGQLVFTTDSHVVSPRFYPGGNIGSLAVYGTVNDLSMMGAKPLALSVALIIEEGFAFKELWQILEHLGQAARHCQLNLACGDTKVVGRGQADGLFINTSGIGIQAPGLTLSPRALRPGQHIIVNGTLGDHGMAVMLQREGIAWENPIQSDAAPLWTPVQEILSAVERSGFATQTISCLRDLTRGGLAAILNELAQSSGQKLSIRESDIPISAAVQAATELLGLDPLCLANEGKFVLFCEPSVSDIVLQTLKAHPSGEQARGIGEVSEVCGGRVEIQTAFGATRLLDWRYSDPLPRIC